MSWLIPVPFLIHGILMVVDEAIHERRGLSTWERRGHPLDSLTVMSCFYFLSLTSPSEENSWLYLGLSIFSTLFVTKDEWIHQQQCGPFEQWLHALLFILHPVILYLAHHMWVTGDQLWLFRGLSIVATGLFFYQLLRWNVPWKKK